MYRTLQNLILASGSPRRQEYFRNLGLDFSVVCAQIDERPGPAESASDFVQRMALEKARSVGQNHPDSWIVSGDTVVCLGGRILGKPANREDAAAMLLQLSGRSHQVRTGFCLSHLAGGVEEVRVVTSRVRFMEFDEAVAKAYVATGEPMDKAGAYGIQGLGAGLVEAVEGSYSNIVGLPLCEVLTLLRQYGVITTGGKK